MKKVLLINGDGVQTVCFARGLKKIGCDVSAICAAKLSQGYYTRYLDKKYLGPEVKEEDAFKEYLLRHLAEHHYDIIIPMEDEGATFLSYHKQEIAKNGKIVVAVPDYPVFDMANNKEKLMAVCKKHGIAHPRTEKIMLSNIKEAAEYVGFPAMIKPDISAGARGIVRVENVEEVKEKLPDITERYGDCTLQQYIEQPNYYYNVMLYRSKEGKILGETVIKIRRFFPLRGGSSCYCETIENEQLVKECRSLLDVLDWHGFADFDILEDKNTGDLKIIEINPRVPSSLQASAAAGVNFPEIFICDYLGGDVQRYQYTTGQQVRWFGLDVMWFLMSPERFSFSPSWFNFFGKRVSYHDGSLKDPLPMIVGCLAGVKNYLNPEFRKAKLEK